MPLTSIGRDEAEHAADLLTRAALTPPVWFTSPMLRAEQTVAVLRERISGEPVVEQDWRLTERNCGALTGLSKHAVLVDHGSQQYLAWRRSMDVAPPAMTAAQRAALGSDARLGLTESLRDVIRRVDAVWTDRIAPALHAAESVLVVAHGNSLRALCAVLDRLDDAAVQRLNIPTGQPLVYRLGDDLVPLVAGGSYLDPIAAAAAAARIALEGGT